MRLPLNYYTSEDEESPVYHMGGWDCPDGGRILAKHLEFGQGTDRDPCLLCVETDVQISGSPQLELVEAAEDVLAALGAFFPRT